MRKHWEVPLYADGKPKRCGVPFVRRMHRRDRMAVASKVVRSSGSGGPCWALGGRVCKIASVLHVVGAFHDALQLSSGGWIAGDEFPRRQNCSIALELLIIRCEFWVPINNGRVLMTARMITGNTSIEHFRQTAYVCAGNVCGDSCRELADGRREPCRACILGTGRLPAIFRPCRQGSLGG